MSSINFTYAALSSEIRGQLVGLGFDTNEIRIVRGSQPTKQAVGAAKDMRKFQVFLTPVTPGKVVMTKTNRIDGEELKADYTHSQMLTWQVDCLTYFDPSDINSIDAHNLCQTINDLMGHFDALKSLRDQGVSIVNCGAVRPSYTIMDSDTYESTPSFDLQINYNSQYTKTVPSTSEVTGEFNEV